MHWRISFFIIIHDIGLGEGPWDCEFWFVCVCGGGGGVIPPNQWNSCCYGPGPWAQKRCVPRLPRIPEISFTQILARALHAQNGRSCKWGLQCRVRTCKFSQIAAHMRAIQRRTTVHDPMPVSWLKAIDLQQIKLLRVRPPPSLGHWSVHIICSFYTLSAHGRLQTHNPFILQAFSPWPSSYLKMAMGWKLVKQTDYVYRAASNGWRGLYS